MRRSVTERIATEPEELDYQKTSSKNPTRMRMHQGRVCIWISELNKYKLRSRIVMERHLGRPLKISELVHHINEVVDDDRISNLMIVSREQHQTIHRTGKKHTDEAKRIISEKLSGPNNLNYGKPICEALRLAVSKPNSKEHCENISKGLKGKPKSETHIANMSKALKGRIITEEWRKNLSEAGKRRVMSESDKLKISQANKGRVRTEEQRKRMSEAAKNRKNKSSEVLYANQN